MAAGVNYCWRMIATGGCFAVFSLGGVALWAFIFPLLRFFQGNRRQERTRYVIHKSCGMFLWLMQFVGIMRMDVEGMEKLKNTEGKLLLINHPTLIDVVVLVSLIPTASCVVKQALWKNYFLGGVVRGAGYISNADSEHLIDDCARDLQKGYPLIIFPEGTRTVPNQPLGFQRGAAYIALRSRKPVLPVLIDCQPSTLTKQKAWYQIPPRAFHLRVRVLDTVDIDQWIEPGEVHTIAARKLTRAFESFFTQELSEWRH